MLSLLVLVKILNLWHHASQNKFTKCCQFLLILLVFFQKHLGEKVSNGVFKGILSWLFEFLANFLVERIRVLKLNIRNIDIWVYIGFPNLVTDRVNLNIRNLKERQIVAPRDDNLHQRLSRILHAKIKILPKNHHIVRQLSPLGDLESNNVDKFLSKVGHFENFSDLLVY